MMLWIPFTWIHHIPSTAQHGPLHLREGRIGKAPHGRQRLPSAPGAAHFDDEVVLLVDAAGDAAAGPIGVP